MPPSGSSAAFYRRVHREANALIDEANLAIVGSEEAITQLRETYEVNRKLPVLTRLKLGLAALAGSS